MKSKEGYLAWIPRNNYDSIKVISVKKLSLYISDHYETRTKEEVCLYAWKIKGIIEDYLKE